MQKLYSNTMNKPAYFPRNWILLRGLTRSQFHWSEFAQNFKTQLELEEVFTPELAGNGILSHLASPTKMDDAIEQLKIQIKNISQSFNQPIGLLGLSLGGMIATAWASREPQLISHLVVINSSFPFLSPFYKRLKPQNYFSVLNQILKNDPQTTEQFILETTSNFSTKWKPKLNQYVEFQKQHPIQFKNVVRQLQLAHEIKISDQPQAQTLIINSLNDHLVDASCSQKISSHLKARLITHTTAGHDLPLDDSDWLIQQIQNWLKVSSSDSISK